MKIIATTLATLGVTYFAAGVLLATAAEQSTSSIQYGQPLRWKAAVAEISDVSLAKIDPVLLWMLGPVVVGLIFATFVLQLAPRQRFTRSLIATVTLALGLAAPVALFGALSFFFTALALLFGTLDGEWIHEFGPVVEGVFVVFSGAMLAGLTRAVVRMNSKAA